MNQLRRVTCGDLTSAAEGAAVELKGWVNTTRDHGGLVFFDLRDRFGVTQVVVDPKVRPEAGTVASSLRSEDVVAVRGSVRRRPAGTENRKLATGEIEVAADTIEVLNRSKTPPFPIHDEGDVEESLRLRYRYLDLRRPNLQRNIALRHRAVKAVRDYLDGRGFLEIETPMLIKQTPLARRRLLRVAAIAATLQAAAHGGRLSPLLPDRALLPR